MKKKVSILILLFLTITLTVATASPMKAVEMRTGNNVSIDSEVDDDLFVTGSTITINEPSESVTAAGETLIINAPVEGDVYFAGRTIIINSTVEGKIVGAASSLRFTGETDNIIFIGRKAEIGKEGVVNKDVFAAGEIFNNYGEIKENLHFSGQKFDNQGTIGSTTWDKGDTFGINELISTIVTVLKLVTMIGFLILGLILIKFVPREFFSISDENKDSPIRNTALGFVGLIGISIVITILGFTLIGIPLALVMCMLFSLGVIISSLTVFHSFAEKLMDILGMEVENNYILFLVGFIMLNILFWIPYLIGDLVLLITVSLGVGSLFYSVKKNWGQIKKLTGF